MSAREKDETPESDRFPDAPHPRFAKTLIGHKMAERDALAALSEGRMPHAWLIGGPEGVGKATFAWSLARFVLANPDPAQAAKSATSLSVSHDTPPGRLIDRLAHPDLALLRRRYEEKRKVFLTQISIDDVRDKMTLFQRTSAFSGWRVCVVDCAEDLNASSANALLKLIEEPPSRSLFLFVAQRPGQMLATIRSRSRLLMMQPLQRDDVARAVTALGAPWSEFGGEIAAASDMAMGSVRKALRLLDGERLTFERRLAGMLSGLPRLDWPAIHALADKVWTNAGLEDYEATIAAIFEWLDQRVLTMAEAGPARLARYAEAWEKVSEAVRETEALNLDKRPLILSIFADLAAAEQAVRR